MKRPRGRLHTTDAAPHVEDGPSDDDSDLEENFKQPLRRCIVTRESGERASMLRFVLAPDRTVLPDLSARLPGRGYWLSARGFMLEAVKLEAALPDKAMPAAALAKLRGPKSRGPEAPAPEARGPDLAGAELAGPESRSPNSSGARAGRKHGLASAFARAARGQVVVPPDLAEMVRSGLYRRVTDHLGLARRAGQAVAGFARAREWVVGGRAGLVVQASDGSADERRRLLSGAGGLPAIWPLDGAALGAVFGRDHVVHVAVASGRLAETLLIETGRLAGVTGRKMMRCPADRGTVDDDVGDDISGG